MCRVHGLVFRVLVFWRDSFGLSRRVQGVGMHYLTAEAPLSPTWRFNVRYIPVMTYDRTHSPLITITYKLGISSRVIIGLQVPCTSKQKPYVQTLNGADPNLPHLCLNPKP